MSKQTKRKLVFTILFATIVVIIFIFNYNYKKHKKTETVSIVKQIVNEKYDKIGYSLDNKALYGMNNENGYFHYDIYDLNGNKLEDFDSTNDVNIVALSEYYYITFDDIYRLYNYDNQELLSSKTMNLLNDYLIRTSNSVVNYKGELLYSDVEKIDSYHNNTFFNINDKYLIDEEGELVYDNCSVIEEIKNSFITDYLIIRKDNKYYTYFPSINTTMGSGFDSYYKENDKVYIFIGYERSQIYSSGVRSSSTEIKIDEKTKKEYILDPANIINGELIFVKNNKKNNYGLLNYNSGKYYSIMDEITDLRKINDNYYVFSNSEESILYDLKYKETVYKSKNKLDRIVYYKNGYKTIKNEDYYYLLDDEDKIIKSSEKQLLLLNEKARVGEFDDFVVLYNDENSIDAEVIRINNSDYIKYVNDNKNIIQNIYNLNTYTSKDFIGNSNNFIMFKDNNKIKIIDLKNDNETSYNLDDDEDVLSSPIKDSIIVGNDKEFRVINSKGKEIKEVEDTKIEEIFYNKNNNKIIIITSDNDKNSVKKGSYVCE